MTMIQAAVIGIAAVVLAVQLKTLRGEFSVYLILAAALIIGFLGISRLELIVETARELGDYIQIPCLKWWGSRILPNLPPESVRTRGIQPWAYRLRCLENFRSWRSAPRFCWHCLRRCRG